MLIMANCGYSKVTLLTKTSRTLKDCGKANYTGQFSASRVKIYRAIGDRKCLTTEIAADVGYDNEKQLQKDFPQLTREITANAKERHYYFNSDKALIAAILQEVAKRLKRN